MWRTRVCELLGIEYPILEGGMSIPGNGQLAAAVSDAGALGMVGWSPGWSLPDEHLGNLQKHIRMAKSLTDMPFGVNIPLAVGSEDTVRASVDLAIDERVPVVVTSGGDPRLLTDSDVRSVGVFLIWTSL